MLGSRGARGRVWIVDDSALEGETTRRALASEHDVLVLADGSVALERLAVEAAPDLLVLDWQMPGVSGIDVCRFLRSKEATQLLPVLMLTTQQQTRDIVEALDAGADDYVVKPFVLEELRARVGALVRVKRLRERVDKAERDVRALLHNLPDALVTVDPRGVLRLVNAEAEKMLGVSGASILGKAISEVLPGLQLAAITSSADNHPLPDLKLGDRVFAPIVRRLATDDATDVTISLRDVSDRRRAEARRMDFYSIIAHDLRAPLSVVTLKTDFILRGRRGPITDETRVDLEANKRRISELVAMVDDFLDLARLEATGMRLDLVPIDLQPLAEETMDDFQIVAETRSVSLHLDVIGAPVVVLGDRRRLAQVFNNLLSNAIKFSGEEGRVRVRIERYEDFVRTEVRDSGVGIRPESLATLFQRYARAADTEHKVAGTGLGLMIVREIVEAHGGKVSATSEPGVGSTFVFEIPIGAPSITEVDALTVSRGSRP